MTQLQKVQQHLESGRTLTPLEALGLYGIMRLSHHILVLRQQGYDISMTMKTARTGVRYGEYKLLKGWRGAA